MNFSRILMGLSLVGSVAVAHADDAITVKAETVEAVVSAPVVDAVKKDDKTILISPRTGMRYTLSNPSNAPIVFKTEVIAPATTENANRIIASNPALSQASQQKAHAALVEIASQAAVHVPAQQ